MTGWIRKYQYTALKSKGISIFGAFLVLTAAGWEFFQLLTAAASVESIPEDLLIVILKQGSAQVFIFLVAGFRLYVLGVAVTARYATIVFTWVICSVSLFLYWASSINLWTCYFADPNSLVCHIYDMSRADVLAGVAPLFLLCSAIRFIVTLFVASFKKLDELDPYC